MSHEYDKSPKREKIPREFFFRRLHSFAGLLFLLFLIEHLFTNAQAALDGESFIHMVNAIHSVPFLSIVEWLFVGFPLLVHIVWGIARMRETKLNTLATDGSAPSLGAYSRNQAFTWQRITSIVLIVAIGLHVYYMRFLHEPKLKGTEYEVTVSNDPELSAFASKLPVVLSTNETGEVTAKADSIGAAFLLVLRDTYKSIPLAIAYSLFVLMAVFHGCNGLWTLCITWGIALTERARDYTRYFSNGLMYLLLFFGLSCIWGVYWL